MLICKWIFERCSIFVCLKFVFRLHYLFHLLQSILWQTIYIERKIYELYLILKLIIFLIGRSFVIWIKFDIWKFLKLQYKIKFKEKKIEKVVAPKYARGIERTAHKGNPSLTTLRRREKKSIPRCVVRASPVTSLSSCQDDGDIAAWCNKLFLFLSLNKANIYSLRSYLKCWK